MFIVFVDVKFVPSNKMSMFIEWVRWNIQISVLAAFILSPDDDIHFITVSVFVLIFLMAVSKHLFSSPCMTQVKPRSPAIYSRIVLSACPKACRAVFTNTEF